MEPIEEIVRLKAAHYDCQVVRQQAEQRMEAINERLRELQAPPAPAQTQTVPEPPQTTG